MRKYGAVIGGSDGDGLARRLVKRDGKMSALLAVTYYLGGVDQE